VRWCVGAFDDRLDVFKRHPGITGMQVGNDGDLELEISGPSRRLDVIAHDTKPQLGLDAEPVRRGRGAEGAQPGKETKELTTRNHEWLIGDAGKL
jgi:hypothetical protein